MRRLGELHEHFVHGPTWVASSRCRRGALTEAVFAIDLGAIAANDPNVPMVNRDPEAFFRATYLTSDTKNSSEETWRVCGKPVTTEFSN